MQQGIDQAGQTLFSAADVPLARIDELLAAVTGAAVKSVLEARIEQIVKHGHSANSDALRPMPLLAIEARSRLIMATDVLFGERKNLPVARRRAVAAAALALAFIDRVDFEMKMEGASQ